MLQTTYHELANLFFVTLSFEKAGDSFPEMDAHTYDHAHFLSNGAVRVEVNGEMTDYKAPALVFIKAGEKHTMTALEDNTIGHCIHALRSADMSGEPLDPALIPKGTSALAVAAPLKTENKFFEPITHLNQHQQNIR